MASGSFKAKRNVPQPSNVGQSNSSRITFANPRKRPQLDASATDNTELVSFKVYPAKDMLRTTRNLHTITENVILGWIPTGTTYVFVTFKFNVDDTSYVLPPDKEDIAHSYFLFQAMMNAMYGENKYKIEAFSIPSNEFLGLKHQKMVENLTVHCGIPISS